MKTISVGELRQNPTQMLADVEAGETYRVTRHNREVARVIPVVPGVELIPAKKRGGAKTRELPVVELRTATSVDELIADLKDDR